MSMSDLSAISNLFNVIYCQLQWQVMLAMRRRRVGSDGRGVHQRFEISCQVVKHLKCECLWIWSVSRKFDSCDEEWERPIKYKFIFVFLYRLPTEDPKINGRPWSDQWMSFIVEQRLVIYSSDWEGRILNADLLNDGCKHCTNFL